MRKKRITDELRLKSHSRLRIQSVLSNESWVQILRKFAACSIIACHCQEHNLPISSFLSPLVSCFPLSDLRHVPDPWVYDEKSRSSFVWMHKNFIQPRITMLMNAGAKEKCLLGFLCLWPVILCSKILNI